MTHRFRDVGLVSDDTEVEAVDLAIGSELDLHTFGPRELKTLIPDWLEACRAQGLADVRIVHGKGKGVLRRTVHALLKRSPHVQSFHLAGQDAGSWGATIVYLVPADSPSD